MTILQYFVRHHQKKRAVSGLKDRNSTTIVQHRLHTTLTGVVVIHSMNHFSGAQYLK